MLFNTTQMKKGDKLPSNISEQVANSLNKGKQCHIFIIKRMHKLSGSALRKKCVGHAGRSDMVFGGIWANNILI